MASHQTDLPATKYTRRITFDVESPNAVHQADLHFLPHERLPRSKKVFSYALTVVDVANRFTAAEPLSSKNSTEVSKAYRCGPLRSPKVLQVDPGHEFMSDVM